MAKLTNLSNEILSNVVSYLTTREKPDVKALLALCHTSRTLSNIAQPALYTRVQISEPRADPLKPLKLFLKTSIKHPYLVEKTQELALFNDRGVSYDWPALQQDGLFMGLSALIGGHLFEIEPELCYYPLAVQVLLRLPNLQHLRFTANIEHPRALLQRIHELRADCSLLSELKTFHLHKQYEDGPVDMRDYLPFMLYPAFERVSTRSDVPDTPDGCNAVNTLSHSAAELLWCMMPLPTLRQLLDVCPHLTSFTFIVPDGSRYRSQWDVGYQPLIAPRDLVKALLELHKHTLKTLHLDFHHYYDLSDTELREEIEDSGEHLDECDYTYPSFRDFERLSHLTLEFEKLVKTDLLPVSLETLHLQHCQFIDFDQNYFSDLVRLKGKWCPVLRYVTVSGWEKTNEGTNVVRGYARSLDAPVHVSADGRILTFLVAGCHLRLCSCKPLLVGGSNDLDERNLGEVEEESVVLDR